MRVTKLRDGVWRHVSGQDLGDGIGWVESNGLIVREADGLVLIDTAWGVEPTIALLDWIERELRLPVRRAIVTHAHDDRLGGAAVLVQRGIPFYGHPLTAEFAPGFHRPPPAVIEGLEKPGSTVKVGGLEVCFPGAGHTRDNIVVWIPSARLLVGGCFVKSAASKTLGNVADADVPAWDDSIRRVQQRYAAGDILVLPGHGEPGGSELLQHTLDLLATAEAQRE